MTTAIDPATLLARGYTARWLAANLPGATATTSTATVAAAGSSLSLSLSATVSTSNHPHDRHAIAVVTPLSADEIDKDIRHMAAYHTAYQRYHQQYYAAMNRAVLIESSAGSIDGIGGVVPAATATTATTATAAAAAAVVGMTAAISSPTLMPVKIDPEEEKRWQQQQRRIAKAEAIRENLEQQYVAVRAHYVQACQKVRDNASAVEMRMQWLEGLLVQTANKVALQRCRVQMSRDVLQALQHRFHVLQQAAVAQGTTMAASSDASSLIAADSPLYNQWIEVEDDLKKICLRGAVSSSLSSSASGGGGAGKSAGTSPNKKETQNNTAVGAVLSWPVAKEPPTTPGVPLLLSTLSLVPEKSVAWSAAGMLGSHQHSLVWLPGHLPIWTDAPPPPRPPMSNKGVSSLSSSSLTQRLRSTTITSGENGPSFIKDHTGLIGNTVATLHATKIPANAEETAPVVRRDSYGTTKHRSVVGRNPVVLAYQDEVHLLERELERERRMNQDCLSAIAKLRVQHDSWVAMLAVVRQETDQILHRHNVLHQSEYAMTAAADRAAQIAAAAVAAAAARAIQEPGNRNPAIMGGHHEDEEGNHDEEVHDAAAEDDDDDEEEEEEDEEEDDGDVDGVPPPPDEVTAEPVPDDEDDDDDDELDVDMDAGAAPSTLEAAPTKVAVRGVGIMMDGQDPTAAETDKTADEAASSEHTDDHQRQSDNGQDEDGDDHEEGEVEETELTAWTDGTPGSSGQGGATFRSKRDLDESNEDNSFSGTGRSKRRKV